MAGGIFQPCYGNIGAAFLNKNSATILLMTAMCCLNPLSELGKVSSCFHLFIGGSDTKQSVCPLLNLLWHMACNTEGVGGEAGLHTMIMHEHNLLVISYTLALGMGKNWRSVCRSKLVAGTLHSSSTDYWRGWARQKRKHWLCQTGKMGINKLEDFLPGPACWNPALCRSARPIFRSVRARLQ
ncbi:hypothetical protein VP01_624g2 [Puccinia sorghi]|uniref:Uncharacterized protein n=1 Tax=Puccinia sorghi TaxID=27349 RepID=A0A0L6UIK1_9BASI|nr:hypothetical protein VP01_624g2 [Puccinia sorghi]